MLKNPVFSRVFGVFFRSASFRPMPPNTLKTGSKRGQKGVKKVSEFSRENVGFFGAQKPVKESDVRCIFVLRLMNFLHIDSHMSSYTASIMRYSFIIFGVNSLTL